MQYSISSYDGVTLQYLQHNSPTLLILLRGKGHKSLVFPLNLSARCCMALISPWEIFPVLFFFQNKYHYRYHPRGPPNTHSRSWIHLQHLVISPIQRYPISHISQNLVVGSMKLNYLDSPLMHVSITGSLWRCHVDVITLLHISLRLQSVLVEIEGFGKVLIHPLLIVEV